ncbi:hypothetical protein Slash_9 [Bacillus phage Slash]|uniref:Uncharacterized protein n=2 Tax=Slashvirus TaxID=1921709 RepID=U5Q099_9CAUD|nr:hypothetical protein Staley_9 [Bacillus phage Staley]YP_008771911.1 hypothetical protein Slash_9 [Bacillus phage Slash]AGY48298.1 hypothetical protein Slash_9 [Bacillus phage Slash]AGY48692.1 hypothetical protein Staley_9 [Bacillus phage Staley]
MSKFKPLEVGDRVFIETRGYYDTGRPTLWEYEVIETNKSSAYVSRIVNGKPKNTDKNLCKRVQQKDGKVIQIFAGYSERLWLSEEAFLDHHHRIELKTLYLEQARVKLTKMSLKELEVFLEVHDD